MPTEDQRVAFRTCPLCEATCGLEITLQGDRVTRIQGDREDVFSRGFLCAKGATLKPLHEDPDRLRKPLIREGGSWREAGWGEAFAAVEKGLAPILANHGRDAAAIYLGNPNVHNLAGSLFTRPLIKALGSKNFYTASTVDQMPKHVSSGLLFGHPDAIPVPDLDRTSYLLMLGANPWHSNGSLCTAPDFPGRVKAIQARGGKVVVVDPRRSRTAREADEHLFIRPGSDALLLLAIASVLCEEDLTAPGELDRHLTGLAEIRRRLVDFNPEATAGVTGVDADTARRLARELAAAPSAAVYGRIGTQTVEFGTLASWAVDLINILTGNLDRAGGAMFSYPAHARVRSGEPKGRGFRTGRWKSRVQGLAEVRGELPVATLADEIETPGEGQVRALITVAGNPALSTPDSGRLDRALGGLDFMVSVDLYLNETTRHADIVLPPPSPLARGHYDLAFYALSIRNVSKYSPPMVAALGPSEEDILARLSLIAGGQGAATDPTLVHQGVLSFLVKREVAAEGSPLAGRDAGEILSALKGSGEAARRGPAERIIDFLVRSGPYGDHFGDRPEGLTFSRLEERPHGIDLGPLQPRLPSNLQTPSGKIELAAGRILEDLDRLKDQLTDMAAIGSNGAFLLVGRRHVRSNNSWMHNIHVLVRGKERCTLQIHPGDADRLGLRAGGRAAVASRVGRVEAPIEITDDIMPGVVSLPHGWGHRFDDTRLSVAKRHPGVNSNILTDPRILDPLSGNAALNGIPVSVEAAAEPAS